MPTILDTLSIQTCVVSYGKEASFAGSLANVAIQVTAKALGVPQLRLVWAATGDIFSSFTDSTVGGNGTPGIIVLPQTGQDGFRHGTSTFKDWYYEAAVTATTSDGQQLSRTYRFQIPAGTTTLDLDMLDEDGIVTAMPAVAPIPTVTSVNGQTGAVTVTGGAGSATIDDTTTATAKVWSSSKAAAYTDAAVLAQAPLAASVRHVRPPRPVKHFVTTFQPGHGWTIASGVGGTAVDSTSNPALGTSSVQLTTNNTGDNFNRLVYASPALGTTVDMTRYDVALLLKVDDFSKLAYLRLRYGTAGDVTTNYRWAEFTNLFNQTPLDEDATPGQWKWQQFSTSGSQTQGTPPAPTAVNRFAISAADKAAGAASIHVGALALVPKNVGLYPHGVIVIWFDDGYYDASSTGAQILDQYGYPAVQSPIWDQVVPTYAGGLYAGLDTLHTLHDVKGWDIVGHATSTAIHGGANGFGFNDLTVPQLHQEFQTLRGNLITNGFERGSDVLAYPLGYHSAQTVSVARQYWTWARTTTSPYTLLGIESLPPADPMMIRTNALDTRALSNFTPIVDDIYNNGGLGIFYTHRVNTSPSSTQISTANFQTFIDYIANKGVPVRTISDVLASLSASELATINGGTP